ncbi:MAG: tetratricopeptide repeat protein, partial [Cyanobacteria bacterium J06638_22]
TPHNNLGIVYRDMKRYEEAIAAYEKAIALDETYATPHNNLGIVYRDMKRYEEAIAAYEKTIALDETNAYPHNELGDVYRDMKRYEEAIAAYKKVGELEPNSAYSKTEIGLTYALQNQLDDAHSAWKDAFSLFEDENWDNLHKALYTLALGESELGLQHLETLLETGVEAEAIEAVLIDADLLTQCPAPPVYVDDFISKLRAELQILQN